MTTNPRYANGHRRRELRKRLLTTGAHCAWPACPWPTDWLNTQTARERHHHDDQFPEVDEIIPIKFGGDPLAADNLRLLHRLRRCNQQRGAGRTAPVAKPSINASPGWGPAT